MDLSFVIPVKNEKKSLPRLTDEIASTCNKNSKSYEIIFVDDGSNDGSFMEIEKIAKKNTKVHCIRLRSNFGKSVALSLGFENAKGNIVFSIDGDLQDDPMEIPNFIKKIEEGYDMVNGWKRKRHDPISKTLPSKVINLAVRILTGLSLHDVNCGFKAYKKIVVKDLTIYGDLYRFIPVLVHRKGFKIAEIPVHHRERKFGTSKYTWRRFLVGFLDLLTIFFLTRFQRRPGHFFGTIGTFLFGIGFIIGLYISYLRVTTGSIQFRHPLLFLGILLLVLGVQFVMTGLLAETIIFFNKREDLSGLIAEKF